MHSPGTSSSTAVLLMGKTVTLQTTMDVSMNGPHLHAVHLPKKPRKHLQSRQGQILSQPAPSWKITHFPDVKVSYRLVNPLVYLCKGQLYSSFGITL
jgi:hypothetical protein